MQYAWLNFRSELLFTRYPDLDRLLRHNPDGVDIAVPGVGVWYLRRSIAPGNGTVMTYTSPTGDWQVCLKNRAPCRLLVD